MYGVPFLMYGSVLGLLLFPFFLITLSTDTMFLFIYMLTILNRTHQFHPLTQDFFSHCLDAKLIFFSLTLKSLAKKCWCPVGYWYDDMIWILSSRAQNNHVFHHHIAISKKNPDREYFTDLMSSALVYCSSLFNVLILCRLYRKLLPGFWEFQLSVWKLLSVEWVGGLGRCVVILVLHCVSTTFKDVPCSFTEIFRITLLDVILYWTFFSDIKKKRGEFWYENTHNNTFEQILVMRIDNKLIHPWTKPFS